MKKLLAIVALVASTGAWAQSGINVEVERERATGGTNTMTDTVKVAPFTEIGGYKVDVQLSGSRDDGSVAGNVNPLQNTVEARAQRMVEVYPGLHLGARLGVGEVLNGVNAQGSTVDFKYYTVEPKAEYFITPQLTALVSYRWRDAFDSAANAYQTKTWKAGFGYAVSNKDLVEIKYFQKRGDYDSNGVALEYTRGF